MTPTKGNENTFSELRQLTAPSARNQHLSELHDAYVTFCEYGWHHLTWKTLAVSLTAYLGTHFTPSTHGRLQNPNINPERSDYLKNLNVEAFGYLVKDALLALFNHASFTHYYGDNLGDHRPFEIPAWRYLSSLPPKELQIVHLEIANTLQELTTSTNSIANILSLTSDWRPTFGAEYGIFDFVGARLTISDSAHLKQLRIDRSVARRPKSFLKRALSMRAIQSRNKTYTTTEIGSESFPKLKRFSWPISERYRRLFRPQPRRSYPVPSMASSQATIQPNVRPESKDLPVLLCPHVVEEQIGKAFKLDHLDESLDYRLMQTMNPFEQQTLYGSPEEMEYSDTWSLESSHTLDSLIRLYERDLNLPLVSQIPHAQSDMIADIFRPDSPILSLPVVISTRLARESLTDLPEVPRPDSPVLASGSSILRNRSSLLRAALSNIPKRSSSPSSGQISFVSARTGLSEKTESRQKFVTQAAASMRTARSLSPKSSMDSFLSFETMFSSRLGLPASSAYHKLLEAHDLIPQRQLELDWSGRGQHAEFDISEHKEIPLEVEQLIGRTRTAVVESVRCKRVRLVRKIVKCGRRTGITRESALKEVQHLYRAQHAHIVRLVGTYAIGTDLSILTYPCAEWNLQQFMDLTRNTKAFRTKCVSSLRQFFTCTAKVMDFLHSFPIKHMDIKPQNLLVRDISTSAFQDTNQYKIYFTDFGISRSYTSADECDTETPTSFTRAYAAREVVIQEVRGLSADMFSLGCVYAEMLATVLDASNKNGELSEDALNYHWNALGAARYHVERGTRPYYSATEDVQMWLSDLMLTEPEMLAIRGLTIALLDNEPTSRPTARQIADDPCLPFSCLSCSLRAGPEDFELAQPLAFAQLDTSTRCLDGAMEASVQIPIVL